MTTLDGDVVVVTGQLATVTRPADSPLPQDIIKAIAEDIGRDTVAYVEVMYPEAIKAASSTFKLSLRNHIYNEIMAAVKINDAGQMTLRLQKRKAFRKWWVEQYRKLRRTKREKPTQPHERLGDKR